MARPRKPSDRLKKFRGYFYLTPELAARLNAEAEKRGGASISDIVRWMLQKELPPLSSVAVSIAEEANEESVND